MKRWYEMRAAAEGGGAEILIYDEIGLWGIKAADFVADLKALGDVPEIAVRINSPGGDVFDGLAIHNVLRRHKAKVVVTVDGIAASIASVIAMAGDEVVMPENAMMMIHDPSGLAWGTAQDMRELADVLDKVKASLIAAYRARAKVDDAELERLMTDETWLSAAQAVELGLADRVEQAVKMAARFDPDCLRNAPDGLRRMLRGEADPAPDADKPEGEKPEAVPEEKPEPEQPEPSEQPSDKSADADKVKAAARQEVLAYVQEVHDLCAMARQPARAAAYIQASTPVAEIRRALVNASADESGADIHNYLPNNNRGGGQPKPSIDVADVYARFNQQRSA
ncbi:MAG: head maturation protease, ClpP-related [Pseudomonadota bacterium]